MPIVTAVENAGCDRRLLAEGAALVHAFDDGRYVIHVLDRDGLEEGVLSDGTESRLSMDTTAEIAAKVTDGYTPVGRIGSPVTEIQHYIERVETQYLVIGGRKRSPIGRAMFGSIT